MRPFYDFEKKPNSSKSLAGEKVLQFVFLFSCLPLQVRWTKTAGSASDKFQDTPIFNETLRIDNIQRVQGGRYYCKAENGVGVAAIKSIRVDVQCKC